MYYDAKRDLDYALLFTKTYQSHTDPAEREAACLALQIPYSLEPIEEDDLIVGGMRHGFVVFSPQYGGVYTYYCHFQSIRDALSSLGSEADESYVGEVENMLAFWEKENTESKVVRKYRETYPDKQASYFSNVSRLAGVNVDLDLLVRAGLSGLKERTGLFRAQNGDSSFYRACDAAVDQLSDACVRYADEAAALKEAASSGRRRELDEIERVFRKIAYQKPDTFREALQLVWLYAVCTNLVNYGRMDHYLGEFYARDIDAGVTTEEEALRVLCSLYKKIIRVGKIHDARIIIGGQGRRNPEAADRLALLLIKASLAVKDVIPQLTLRYYEGMNKALMEETLHNITEGAVYPIVYSDDTTLPAIEKIYGVDRDVACSWVPLGCGEYTLEGYGSASPNSCLVVPKALDLLLHRGVNSFTGEFEMSGLADPTEYRTFDELFEALSDLARVACERMTLYDELNYRIGAEEACYLHTSLLTHDCVEKNLPLLSGGGRFLGDTSEIFGLITSADSLTAIKHCVYDRGLFTLSELIAMCDANFEGYEKERNLLLAAPKYGNDDDEADAMAVRLFNCLADRHEKAAEKTNLFPYKICSVNNSGSAEQGAGVSATPCGRLKGQAFSNGHSPSLGVDRNGLTATLNSMAKFDAARHVGVVHNIRFERELLKNNRDKIQTVLETFFQNNGVQANLSSIGKDDLKQALIHPELYKNLLVRIGGFSARFVELDPVVQRELVARTTYEELS